MDYYLYTKSWVIYQKKKNPQNKKTNTNNTPTKTYTKANTNNHKNRWQRASPNQHLLEPRPPQKVPSIQVFPRLWTIILHLAELILSTAVMWRWSKGTLGYNLKAHRKESSFLLPVLDMVVFRAYWLLQVTETSVLLVFWILCHCDMVSSTSSPHQHITSPPQHENQP